MALTLNSQGDAVTQEWNGDNGWNEIHASAKDIVNDTSLSPEDRSRALTRLSGNIEIPGMQGKLYGQTLTPSALESIVRAGGDIKYAADGETQQITGLSPQQITQTALSDPAQQKSIATNMSKWSGMPANKITPDVIQKYASGQMPELEQAIHGAYNTHDDAESKAFRMKAFKSIAGMVAGVGLAGGFAGEMGNIADLYGTGSAGPTGIWGSNGETIGSGGNGLDALNSFDTLSPIDPWNPINQFNNVPPGLPEQLSGPGYEPSPYEPPPEIPGPPEQLGGPPEIPPSDLPPGDPSDWYPPDSPRVPPGGPPEWDGKIPPTTPGGPGTPGLPKIPTIPNPGGGTNPNPGTGGGLPGGNLLPGLVSAGTNAAMFSWLKDYITQHGDPFGAQRPNYFQPTQNASNYLDTASSALSKATANPDSLLQPGGAISNMVDYNTNAIQRKMAAQGYNTTGSTPGGNSLMEMSNTANQTAGQYIPSFLNSMSGGVNSLSGGLQQQANTAGANINPGAAIQTAGSILPGLASSVGGNIFAGIGSNTSSGGITLQQILDAAKKGGSALQDLFSGVGDGSGGTTVTNEQPVGGAPIGTGNEGDWFPEGSSSGGETYNPDSMQTYATPQSLNQTTRQPSSSQGFVVGERSPYDNTPINTGNLNLGQGATMVGNGVYNQSPSTNQWGTSDFNGTQLPNQSASGHYANLMGTPSWVNTDSNGNNVW